MTMPPRFTAAGPAEVLLPCADLAPSLEFFQALGFLIDAIFPADAPTTASLSGHGLRLRLAPGDGHAPQIRLPCNDGELVGRTLTAPNGARIEFVDPEPALHLPSLQPAFHIIRAGDAGSEPGRAGMLYRDLIPGRLGGRYIASHIAIPDGGPVSDWVHYHRVRFQFLICRRGWAQLVYEDQGEPFRLEAGDLVLQPPLIRHRVLESSPGFEVVEIACPALHETLADHDMDLPNGRLAPDRDFCGQRFLHSRAAKIPWSPWGDTGFEARDTRLARFSGGLVDAVVVRASGAHDFATPAGDAELTFGFLMSGSARLQARGDHALGPCDAFVVPQGEGWRLTKASPDAEILIVRSPAP
jgi:uncharacterized protein YjlB